MHRMRDTTSSQSTTLRSPRPPAIRTYRQIAEILSERWGTPVGPEHAMRMCQAAERKFVLTLLTDPVFHEWLGPIANHHLSMDTN